MGKRVSKVSPQPSAFSRQKEGWTKWGKAVRNDNPTVAFTFIFVVKFSINII